MTGHDRDGEGTWLGLRQAAPLLGVASAEALRRRIRRGTFGHPHRRDNAGAWQVLVPERLTGRAAADVPSVPAVPSDVRDALLAEKDARIADLTAERNRLLAVVERLAAERRPERRPWPGLRAWWRRLVEGEG